MGDELVPEMHDVGKFWQRTEIIALDLYKKGKISLGKAGEMLGLSKREMFSLLNYKEIPINYDAYDLKSDIQVLDRLMR